MQHILVVASKPLWRSRASINGTAWYNSPITESAVHGTLYPKGDETAVMILEAKCSLRGCSILLMS